MFAIVLFIAFSILSFTSLQRNFTECRSDSRLRLRSLRAIKLVLLIKQPSKQPTPAPSLFKVLSCLRKLMRCATGDREPSPCWDVKQFTLFHHPPDGVRRMINSTHNRLFASHHRIKGKAFSVARVILKKGVSSRAHDGVSAHREVKARGKVGLCYGASPDVDLAEK